MQFGKTYLIVHVKAHDKGSGREVCRQPDGVSAMLHPGENWAKNVDHCNRDSLEVQD